MADLVLAARFLSAPEAMIARALLESEGVMALAPDEHALSALPHVILGDGGYRLMVREQDLDRALEILREAQLAPAEEG